MSQVLSAVGTFLLPLVILDYGAVGEFTPVFANGLPGLVMPLAPKLYPREFAAAPSAAHKAVAIS
jgi:hypothetical protein